MKSDTFVSGINQRLKMLAMRFHPTLTGSWYDAARFVATCPQKIGRRHLGLWGASGDGISIAEVRNEALFVSVGYRSGFLGHWAHEELAKEDCRSQISAETLIL